MYCSKCGKENPDNAIYCSKCGEKIGGVSGAKDEKPVEESRAVSSENLEEKPKIESVNYGTFWLRLGAYLTDLGFATLFAFILSYILAILLGNPYLEFIETVDENIFGYGIFVIYSAIFLAIFSTTPGKAVYGFKVLRKESKGKITLVVSIVRPFLQILSTFLFGIGYWNMNKNQYRQAWHDKQTDTVVVGKPKNLGVSIIVMVISLLVLLYFNLE